MIFAVCQWITAKIKIIPHLTILPPPKTKLQKLIKNKSTNLGDISVI